MVFMTEMRGLQHLLLSSWAFTAGNELDRTHQERGAEPMGCEALTEKDYRLLQLDGHPLKSPNCRCTNPCKTRLDSLRLILEGLPHLLETWCHEYGIVVDQDLRLSNKGQDDMTCILATQMHVVQAFVPILHLRLLWSSIVELVNERVPRLCQE
jgi:hypothetical protein